jgi:hypothetical protein
MPLCGFNKKMIHGITIFSEGLFEATLQRANEQNIDLQTAFRAEVEEIGLFLEALESKYQELKKTNSAEETMRKAVQWIDQNGK